MNKWNEYLSSLGAPAGPVAHFGRTLSGEHLAAGFVAILTDQDRIEVIGEDGPAFLHGQLTNDVEHLGQGEIRLAGYCSPKGRLLASFLMWRGEHAVYLQLPSELRPSVQKRLSMFVMRAKAKLEDATGMPGKEVLLGIGGAAGVQAVAALFGALPAAPYTRLDHELGTLLRVADAFGAPRYQWLASADAALKALPALTATLALGGNDAWHLSDIHAGVPQITAATQEQFVPQMINFELLGGVNFKKGCYPGQEIVARSQYLGKLKRRTALASTAALAKAGDEVFDVADPGQPCGMVVNAAPNGHGGTDLLVELKLAALEGGDIRHSSATGDALAFQPMPYALDAIDV
jgi:folate-binding protein YgfZ